MQGSPAVCDGTVYPQWTLEVDLDQMLGMSTDIALDLSVHECGLQQGCAPFE